MDVDVKPQDALKLPPSDTPSTSIDRVNRPLGLNPNLLFENAPLAMFVVDSNGQTQSWNRLAEILCGVPCTFQDAIDVDQLLPGIGPTLRELIENTNDYGHANRNEWSSTIQGKQLDLRLFFSQVQNKSNQFQTFLLTVEDFTEYRSSERELRAGNVQLNRQAKNDNAEAKRAREELESFCFSIAHDLRTPLRAIDGFGFALQNDYRSVLDSQAHDYIDRIRTAGKRMDQLIDALLWLTRLTRAELYATNVDLSALARSVIVDLYDRYEGTVFNVNIEPNLETYGDPRLLRLLLENLLDNAAKFSQSKDQPEIQLFATEQGGKLVFCVKDNGIGFDMSYAARLFRPFETLHSPGEFEGHSVGLAVVKRVIGRHGGEVWAESQEGKGAAFYFSLPEPHHND